MSPRQEANRTLTAIEGITVGHAQVPGGGSGCTVILGPFRAAVEITGMATGTREFDTLAPEHLVPQADAIVLSGGSAYGLASAHGVMAWLAERGRGYPTGVAPVPIVPAAILYDLGRDRSRPDAATGLMACENASSAPVPEGRVGAGTGATVGKVPYGGPALAGGNPSSMPGGIGSALVEVGGVKVAAIAAVNAVGDVLDAQGNIVAGLRAPDGTFLDASRVLLDYAPAEFAGWNLPGAEGAGSPDREPAPADRTEGELLPGTNTTLCLVATDAPVSQADLRRICRVAATAMARRIRPVNTPFDGDVVFAVCPNPEVQDVSSGAVLALGNAAREALEMALTRAVLSDEARSREG